ncbi:MAG TPA: biotin--[acetyl-CoA-carboxylase] ligase [Granulicella sp.]|nr:biotin--[acetyl-CoA-carboxylase] ligase [Granulicella sp.]
MTHFDLAHIDRALASTRFAGKLHHFETIGSTNIHAVDAASTGAPDGSVYIADEQTAGRGRGGHTWHSIPGDGLYLSALIRPSTPIPLADALWISLSTGLAAQRAIHQTTGLVADIRWPNDLILNTKKVGGILVESASTPATAQHPAHLRFAVIGIGINVNHAEFPAELAPLATSLRLEKGRESGAPHSRESLVQNLLLALDDELYALELELRGDLPTPAPPGDGSAAAGLLARFTRASTWIHGMHVRVDEAGGYTGITAGLDARGFLQVAGDDGLLHTVLSGGVRPA